jgi:hypothetical protein
MLAPSGLRGRAEVLQRLDAALTAALAGRGQVVVVSGEAGIGKSSVASAIAGEAEARGASVTWGRAWEFADAPPYFPLGPCLRALGVALDTSDPFHLWESVAAALAGHSTERPIVWIVEDVHAADLGTLDLLTFLSLPLRALPALVIATARDKDARITERVAQRLARMARDGGDVRLEPLCERDVAALAATTVGHELPEPAVRRLVEITGGNPLFVVECARAFRVASSIDGALRALPQTVLQVVLGRVALLPHATRNMLQSGAVLGREFTAASIARMHDSLPARVIDAMLPGLRAGIVAETKPGSFAFSHALVREAIYGAISAGDRASLHGRADVALQALGDRADVLLERARHALAAVTFGGGDVENALRLIDGASDLLEREEAFDRAFDLLSRVEDAERAGSVPASSVAKRMRFAEVARAAGRSDVMRRLCEEIVADSRTSGDADALARAVLLHASDVRPGVIDSNQVALLAEARARLGDSAPALGARLLARHATALQPAKDESVPGTMAREAIVRARAIGDDLALLDVLDQARWGLYSAAHAERLAIATELLELSVRRSDRVKSLNAHCFLAWLALEVGDFSAFQRTVESVLALSVELGHPRYRWRALLLASLRSMMRGDFSDAERFVTELSELGALVDDAAFPVSFVLHQVLRLRFQRRDDEMMAAEQQLDAALSSVADARLHLAALHAACAARRGDVEATRKALASIDGQEEAILTTDPSFLCLLAEAAAIAGTELQQRRCRAALERLEAQVIGSSEMAFVYEGTVVRLLGLLDAGLGRFDRAETQLREALSHASDLGHRAWVAQIAFELAAVLRAAGRAAEAEAFREQAFELARELGMPGLEAATAPRTHTPAPTEPASRPSIVKKGDRVRIERSKQTVWVKDSRGVQLLARLVAQPNEEIHVLALASDEGASLPESNAGEMLDERARLEYRDRLRDLEEALAEAEGRLDVGRIARLREEREALHSELARAVGLGGRARAAGSATERARVNVQRRLKDAIARVTEADADLGRYFERAIRTGTFCSFRP